MASMKCFNKNAINIHSEKEIKYMLTKDDFYKLKEYFENHSSYWQKIVQSNIYFDTKDMYYHNMNTTIKIRKIGESNNLTIKFNAPNTHQTLSNYKSKLEYNIELNTLDYNEQISSIIEVHRKRFSDISIESKQVFPLAELKTHRTEYIMLDYDLVVQLDKSNYMDIIDYELECETNTYAKSCEILTNIFMELCIDFNLSCQSKRVRCLREAQYV